ncbi:MAG: hypothetical protein ACR2M1_07585 [Gemmatimonadaceae bacterium]
MLNHPFSSNGATAGGSPPTEAALARIIDRLMYEYRAGIRAQLDWATRDAGLETADALDLGLDEVLDAVMRAPTAESDSAFVESVYATIPVERVWVMLDPRVGQRAWSAVYVIRDGDEFNNPVRPPIEKIIIGRSDREGPTINAAELDVLAIELDTLAADPSVEWESTIHEGPGDSRTYELESRIGVSGTPRDRLTVEVRAGVRMGTVLDGKIERVLGLLYRMLDFSNATFDIDRQ